jgi:hypothetical protein
MAKVIKLSEINSSVQWIETKVNGDKKGWLQTERSSFTGKTKKIGLLGEVMSFTRWENTGTSKMFQIAAPEKVSARVKIWNKETYENEIYKIIF